MNSDYYKKGSILDFYLDIKSHNNRNNTKNLLCTLKRFTAEFKLATTHENVKLKELLDIFNKYTHLLSLKEWNEKIVEI